MIAAGKAAAQVSQGVFVARQFCVNLVVSVIMTIVMTLLIFHGRDAVPLWGLGNLVFDLVPSTLLPTLAATMAISKVTGAAMRKGLIDPLPPTGWARLPRNDALAGLALGAGLLVVLGAGYVIALTLTCHDRPIAIPAVIGCKLVYAAILCLANTPVIVARARMQSGRGPHEDRSA